MLSEVLKSLNDKQLEAVKTTEGYVRVIAGAGSGKTKALTVRFAYIAEYLGVNPSNMVCVTFTNKAAYEMKRRVKQLIGDTYDLSYITTYHGFCVRILREDINKIQYPKSFIILDVDDQKTILREIYHELGYDSKDFSFKQVLTYISNKKNHLDYLGYVIENQRIEQPEPLDQIFMKYLEKQQRNYALDFDDLLLFTLHIFTHFEDVLHKWQHRLHYIQVDEAQDSSQSQFKLMEMLSAVHQNLFVVGDPDQTIYEWRGAIPEILVHFDKKYPDSKTILMNQNYRSTPNILNIGNQIIKNNKVRVDKEMFTLNTGGKEVFHFHASNDVEEAEWIAKEIKELIKKEEAQYSDITILYRASYLSRNIEQMFIKESIPYLILGGIRFFERKEIKDVLAYLRLIVFGDDISFLRMINHPTRGLGKKFMEQLSVISEQKETSLLQTLKEVIRLKEFNKKGAIQFLDLLARFQQVAKEKTVSDLVKIILDESGLSKLYRADGDEERLENIQELQSSMITLETENKEPILIEEYLQEIALYTDLDISKENEDKVKLMTIHISKGLEFPYVFLCGFSEGVMPSALAIKERRKRALEEERRLVYVAVTRAEKRFYMTESEGFNATAGMQKYPSRFLFEINENSYQRKGFLKPEIIAEAKSYIRKQEALLMDVFEIGTIIGHPVWGKGKIIDINYSKNEYMIEFYEIGKVKPIDFSYKYFE